MDQSTSGARKSEAPIIVTRATATRTTTKRRGEDDDEDVVGRTTTSRTTTTTATKKKTFFTPARQKVIIIVVLLFWGLVAPVILSLPPSAVRIVILLILLVSGRSSVLGENNNAEEEEDDDNKRNNIYCNEGRREFFLLRPCRQQDRRRRLLLSNPAPLEQEEGGCVVLHPPFWRRCYYSTNTITSTQPAPTLKNSDRDISGGGEVKKTQERSCSSTTSTTKDPPPVGGRLYYHHWGKEDKTSLSSSQSRSPTRSGRRNIPDCRRRGGGQRLNKELSFHKNRHHQSVVIPVLCSPRSLTLALLMLAVVSSALRTSSGVLLHHQRSSSSSHHHQLLRHFSTPPFAKPRSSTTTSGRGRRRREGLGLVSIVSSGDLTIIPWKKTTTTTVGRGGLRSSITCGRHRVVAAGVTSLVISSYSSHACPSSLTNQRRPWHDGTSHGTTRRAAKMATTTTACAAATTNEAPSSSARSKRQQRLILVGGGHAHIQVIKSLNASVRPSNLAITLVDVTSYASYSGMVPGCVAQLYDPAETQIPLGPLAAWSGIEFVEGEVVDVDAEERKVLVSKKNAVDIGDCGDVAEDERVWIDFDVLSLDIGSTSRAMTTTTSSTITDDSDGDGRGRGGADGELWRQYVIPTRPISQLVRRTSDAQRQIRDHPEQYRTHGVHVLVVGSGIAGIELSFAIRARFGGISRSSSSLGIDEEVPVKVTVLSSASQIVPDESEECRGALTRALEDRGITVRYNTYVKDVQPSHVVVARSSSGGASSSGVNEEEESIPYTHCLWATGASPHKLAHVTLRRRGLGVSKEGWIRVKSTLQSVTHDHIFAAGDCVTIESGAGTAGGGASSSSPPKAGVYAVRSGPILIENLTNYLGSISSSVTPSHSPSDVPKKEDDEGDDADAILKRYVPQNDFLKLIMCGDGTAIGFRYGLAIQGSWVWKLKDHIDRSFMDLFNVDLLPPPPRSSSADEEEGDTNGVDEGEKEEGNGGERKKYDTSQYDAVEDVEPPLEPAEAAALLRRRDATDDADDRRVDYLRAWKVLRNMRDDDDYRDAVLGVMSPLAF